MAKKELSDKSLCKDCLHYDNYNGIHSCPAYPPFPPFNGIPLPFLTGEKKHLKPTEGQFTKDMVFEKSIFNTL